MMAGDGGRIRGLLLYGFGPALVTPAAGVGGVHADHRQAAARRHADQSIPEPAGRNTRHGAAQPLTPLAAAQGFAPGGPRIGEIQVLDHDRPTSVVLGVVE
jgi:hypothetical protein